MATYPGYDCRAAGAHIGFSDCVLDPGNEKGHIRMPIDFTIDLDAVTFDEDYVSARAQDGTFEFVANAFSQITETAEDGTETSPTGEQSLVQRGKPMTTTIVKEGGYERHSKIYGTAGNGRYAVMPIFSGNVIMAARTGTTGNVIRGFSTSMYTVGGFQPTNGTVSQQSIIKYQMNNEYQWNTLGVFLTGLDFDAVTGVRNIADVYFGDANGLVAEADVTANKIKLPINYDTNRKAPVSGWAASNFRLLINGVANPVSGTVTKNADGRWYITPTATLATNDVVEVYTTDATASVDVAKQADGRMFSGYIKLVAA